MDPSTAYLLVDWTEINTTNNNAHYLMELLEDSTRRRRDKTTGNEQLLNAWQIWPSQRGLPSTIQMAQVLFRFDKVCNVNFNYLVFLHTFWVKKNWATFIFTVTLANVGRFLKFFQCRNQKEMAHNKNEKFPTVA